MSRGVCNQPYSSERKERGRDNREGKKNRKGRREKGRPFRSAGAPLRRRKLKHQHAGWGGDSQRGNTADAPFCSVVMAAKREAD